MQQGSSLLLLHPATFRSFLGCNKGHAISPGSLAQTPFHHHRHIRRPLLGYEHPIAPRHPRFPQLRFLPSPIPPCSPGAAARPGRRGAQPAPSPTVRRRGAGDRDSFPTVPRQCTTAEAVSTLLSRFPHKHHSIYQQRVLRYCVILYCGEPPNSLAFRRKLLFESVKMHMYTSKFNSRFKSKSGKQKVSKLFY